MAASEELFNEINEDDDEDEYILVNPLLSHATPPQSNVATTSTIVVTVPTLAFLASLLRLVVVVVVLPSTVVSCGRFELAVFRSILSVVRRYISGERMLLFDYPCTRNVKNIVPV